MGNKSHALVPLGVYQCSDGPIMIVVGNDRQFEKFCRDVLKRPDMLEGPKVCVSRQAAGQSRAA